MVHASLLLAFALNAGQLLRPHICLQAPLLPSPEGRQRWPLPRAPARHKSALCPRRCRHRQAGRSGWRRCAAAACACSRGQCRFHPYKGAGRPSVSMHKCLCKHRLFWHAQQSQVQPATRCMKPRRPSAHADTNRSRGTHLADSLTTGEMRVQCAPLSPSSSSHQSLKAVGVRSAPP